MTNVPLFSDAIRTRLPPLDADESAYPTTFATLADLVLNYATLHVQGVEHRFTEVEFYFHGRKHLDGFTHGDPMQKRFGRWYFHRTGGAYRGGTYKGLDIAFGDDDAHGGILVRGVERLAPASRVDGPCKVVDHLLALTRAPTIRDLVARFDLSVDAPGGAPSPLHVTCRADGFGRVVYESPRVGLSLKRANTPDRHRYIARSYRFLTEPERATKGKAHLGVALHRRGLAPEQIAAITATKPAVVRAWLDAYARGLAAHPSVFGGELSTADTCALFGACDGALTKPSHT